MELVVETEFSPFLMFYLSTAGAVIGALITALALLYKGLISNKLESLKETLEKYCLNNQAEHTEMWGRIYRHRHVGGCDVKNCHVEIEEVIVPKD